MKNVRGVVILVIEIEQKVQTEIQTLDPPPLMITGSEKVANWQPFLQMFSEAIAETCKNQIIWFLLNIVRFWSNFITEKTRLKKMSPRDNIYCPQTFFENLYHYKYVDSVQLTFLTASNNLFCIPSYKNLNFCWLHVDVDNDVI